MVDLERKRLEKMKKREVKQGKTGSKNGEVGREM